MQIIETWTKNGAKRVELFAPVRVAGKVVKQITIRPVQLDHVVRWGENQFAGQLALLAELTGHDETTLRMLTYPDVDRVFAAYVSMLPDAIRNSAGQQPRMNGSGEMPLPSQQEIDQHIDRPFDDSVVG